MTLTNRDWDTVAREASGTTLDAALAARTLEATRDIKKWEHALLQEQLAVLEGRGVDAWLETAKRGLGLFLCLDSAGRLIVSGVESPSSASEEGDGSQQADVAISVPILQDPMAWESES